ncbi:glycosyltransferase family 2 protein, partial [Candidatus Woesearchaeota archaeon]|nr:glycosyltransferase family 2 protein [Candidatus Woesearchaeota archaeon]
MDVSIVIPCFNEGDNVTLLYNKISSVMKGAGKSYEIIFVDDGSTDQTYNRLAEIRKKDERLKIIKFRRNFGQTAAMDAGFKHSIGKIVIAMDADLQNDPEDIPRFLERINQGYDVVSGWRFQRNDSITKKLFSKIANSLRRSLTEEKIHDSGCSFKAYKRECFDDLDLYGEMHRYIPALLLWRGFKVTEIKVKHHPRKFGKTKYNLKRIIKGFLDLLVILFWYKYSTRPIHFFGGLGILSSLTGTVIGGYLISLKFFYNTSIGNRPLLLLSMLLVILGVQLLLMGFLADILI